MYLMIKVEILCREFKTKLIMLLNVTVHFVNLYTSSGTPLQSRVGLVEVCGSDAEIRKFGRWLVERG